MKNKAATCLLLLLVCTPGCSKDESGTSSYEPTTEATSESIPQTSGGAAVADADWRAVIDDWYDNGVIDESHSCVAVRAAIEHVPRSSPNPHTAFEDLGRYEAKGCQG